MTDIRKQLDKDDWKYYLIISIFIVVFILFWYYIFTIASETREYNLKTIEINKQILKEAQE